MFYRYEIKDYYGKNVLYLYCSMTEEVSNELGHNDIDKLSKRINNYIQNKNIKYSGDEVFLVVDGIVVKSIPIKKSVVNIEVLDDGCSYGNFKYTITLRENNREIMISLKEYLMGVLFTNCTYNMHIELMKALCVLYRTYAFYKMQEDGFIDTSDPFMKYQNVSYYKLLFTDNFKNIYEKLERAVDSTDCIFITYQDLYIKPYIHDTNNGFTEDSSEIPYLIRRYSLWDLLSPNYLNIKEISYDKLEKLLNVGKKELQNIKILELTSGNKIRKLKIGSKTFLGEDFCQKLQLSSTDLTILINDQHIKFIARGNGHGLGLSLNGSLELAKSGCDYLQILNYYFPKCIVKKYV